MKLWLPLPANNFCRPAIILILIFSLSLLSATGGQAADTPLAETLITAAETTPELREEREQIADLEREIELLRARAGWQVMTTGSYRRGEETVEFIEEEPENIPENGEDDPLNAENFSDNEEDNTEVQSFSSLSLGLGVNRAFISGFELESEISYLDRDPIDTDNISDNLNFSLEGSYQLWPQVPTELEQSLVNLEKQLHLAEEELARSREDFYLELLRDYLEITILQEEIKLTEKRLDLIENRWERARERRDMEEAGELEIRELELAAKQAENSLNTLTRNLSTARQNFQHKLSDAEEPDYKLEADIWQRLEDSFLPEADLIADRGREIEELLEEKRGASVEYARLQEEKDRVEREFARYESELQPHVDVSAGSQDIADGEWHAALNVSYALYQGGRKDLETEEYEAEIAGLEQDLQDLNFALNQQLQALLNEVENSREAEERAGLQLERSELELEKEQQAYDRGAADELDLKDLRIEKQDDFLDYKQNKREALLTQIELVSSLDYLLLEEVLKYD